MSNAIDKIKQLIVAYLGLESQDALSRRDLAEEGRLLRKIETLRIEQGLSETQIDEMWIKEKHIITDENNSCQECQQNVLKPDCNNCEVATDKDGDRIPI